VDQRLRRDPAETRIQRRRLRLKMTNARVNKNLSTLAVLIGIVGSSGLLVFADSQKALPVPPRPTSFTENIILFVAPQMVACSPSRIGLRKVDPSTITRRCIQTSTNENGPFGPDAIGGFSFISGFKYKLLVSATIDFSITDASAYLQLIKVLKKTPIK
jgi:hypothetical protein